MKTPRRRLLNLFLLTLPTLGEKEQRLLWLIRLRFIAIFIQFPLTFLGRHYGYLLSTHHLLFILILSAFLAYNLFIYYRITHKKDYKIGNLFLSSQISLDLLIFTLLLSLTGGINNPFYAFFYVMAVFGGIFSAGAGSIIFFAALVTSLFVIQIYPLISSHFSFNLVLARQTMPYLLIQLFIPSLIFLVSRSFGEFLEKNQNSLLSMALHSERLDRLRALGALSAGFSHEFASPLHSAQIRLRRLARALPPGNSDLTECELALKDCENVLKQMNSSQLDIEKTDFDIINLSGVINEIIEMWKRDYPHINVNTSLSNQTIRASRINFTQAMFNLLDNSAEAMDNSGTIFVAVKRAEDRVVISLQDQGNGVPKEILQHLGTPFNTTKLHGTGLGLYSISLFMQAVGGKMSVSNLDEGGAVVKLTFPGQF